MDNSIDLNDETLTAHINKIEINQGDLILVKVPRGYQPSNQMLKDVIVHVRNQGGFLIFAAKDIDIEKITEEQMEKLGWVRKNASNKIE